MKFSGVFYFIVFIYFKAGVHPDFPASSTSQVSASCFWSQVKKHISLILEIDPV